MAMSLATRDWLECSDDDDDLLAGRSEVSDVGSKSSVVSLDIPEPLELEQVSPIGSEVSLEIQAEEHHDEDSDNGNGSDIGSCAFVDSDIGEGVSEMALSVDGVSSNPGRDGVSSRSALPSMVGMPWICGETWGCGGSSGPQPTWSEATVSPLNDMQINCIRRNAALTAERICLVGSDCSGSDAVWEALGFLTNRWQTMLGCQHRSRKEFCSEHPGKEGDAPRNFLTFNSRPRIMFRDMCEREATGFCSYKNMKVATPRVHLYSAGWVCRDDSYANTRRRRPVTMSCSEAAGDSTRTLHSSIRYIRSHRPWVVVLENPMKLNNIRVAVDLLHDVPRYALVVFKVNSTSFHTPASRPRMYIVAINLDEVTIKTPLRDWHRVLAAIGDQMPPAAVQDYLLPDEHPHVQQFLRELSVGSTERRWRSCKMLHKRVRRAFKRKYGDGMLDTANLRKAVLSMPGSAHLHVLTPRQLDVYGLHVWASKIALGTDLTRADLVIDVTNNVTMAACKHLGRSGTMPCLLRTHQYVHTQRARPICGTERMRMQGFSRHLILSDGGGPGGVSPGQVQQISQRDLCALAGDTMSVPVMGSLLAVVFSCCLFESPNARVTVEEAEQGLP